jgi:hypothetical protein
MYFGGKAMEGACGKTVKVITKKIGEANRIWK